MLCPGLFQDITPIKSYTYIPVFFRRSGKIPESVKEDSDGTASRG
jgi:hypothetical protein